MCCPYAARTLPVRCPCAALPLTTRASRCQPPPSAFAVPPHAEMARRETLPSPCARRQRAAPTVAPAAAPSACSQRVFSSLTAKFLLIALSPQSAPDHGRCTHVRARARAPRLALAVLRKQARTACAGLTRDSARRAGYARRDGRVVWCWRARP
eukprot:IDg20354t1